MKLYSVDLSPYAARTRLHAYAKGLDVEIVEPPGGLGSDTYRQIAPIGKVPALEVDGQVIPESEVIAEYLEDTFPTPSLRPADPAQRARARLLARLVDLYVSSKLGGLFGQLDPKTRDPALVEAALGELATDLDRIEAYIDKGPYAVAGSLSTADCALVPVFFFLTRLLPMLGADDPFEGRPKTGAWWDTIQKDPHASRVLAEMGQAMKESFGA